MSTIVVFIIVAISLVIYSLPAIVASNMGHKSAGAIIFLNMLLGWTLIGWVVAFVWSFTDSTQVIVNNQTTKSASDEIQKLAALKEQGLLTEDEFNKRKQQIL
jgi:uncharacterized membrane protein